MYTNNNNKTGTETIGNRCRPRWAELSRTKGWPRPSWVPHLINRQWLHTLNTCPSIRIGLKLLGDIRTELTLRSAGFCSFFPLLLLLRSQFCCYVSCFVTCQNPFLSLCKFTVSHTWSKSNRVGWEIYKIVASNATATKTNLFEFGDFPKE